MAKPKTEDIQKYARYLLNRYKQIGGGGYLQIQLEEFIEKNRIKDLFEQNRKQESKVRFMEALKGDIELFARSMERSVDLKTFKQFMTDDKD